MKCPFCGFEEDKVIFPALPFPELEHLYAVSGSPSKEAHDFLVEKYNLENQDEHATIIVGFDEVQH